MAATRKLTPAQLTALRAAVDGDLRVRGIRHSRRFYDRASDRRFREVTVDSLFSLNYVYFDFGREAGLVTPIVATDAGRAALSAATDGHSEKGSR